MTVLDRDAQAKAQLQALARVVAAPGHGGGLTETLVALVEGVRSAFGFDGVVDLLDEEHDVYIVRAGVGEGTDDLVGRSIPRPELEAMLDDRFEAIPDVYFVPHGAAVDWRELGDSVYVPDLPSAGEGRWHPEDVCLVRLRTSDGKSLGYLSVHSPSGQRAPDRSTFEQLRLFAVVGANTVETLVLQNRMAGMEAQQELERLRRDLFRTVSHELRTPVTSIRGLADVVARDSTPEAQRKEYAAVMAQQAEHLTELLNDLLAAERAGAVSLSVSTRPVDVDDAVARAAIVAGLNEDPRVRISRSAMVVLADPTRLVQALANLLSNAAKYAPAGLLYAQAWRVGDRVRIEVEDDGPGIPENELSRVFDPFHRCGAPESAEGTGLGLYVTKQLVEAMGGIITCRSQPGVGSRFTIDLPVA